jgi:hypothetical protein
MKTSATALLALTCLLGACTTVTHRAYTPFVRSLDGNSELCISTYPAWYPHNKPGGTSGFKQVETHGELNFQVHIRGAKKKQGPDDQVNSVKIRSFAYQLDDGPKIELLTDYPNNFWMQGNPRYQKDNLPPVPYLPDSVIHVQIDFTLNGKSYNFKGEMKPSESKTTMPTNILKSSI